MPEWGSDEDMAAISSNENSSASNSPGLTGVPTRDLSGVPTSGLTGVPPMNESVKESDSANETSPGPWNLRLRLHSCQRRSRRRARRASLSRRARRSALRRPASRFSRFSRRNASSATASFIALKTRKYNAIDHTANKEVIAKLGANFCSPIIIRPISHNTFNDAMAIGAESLVILGQYNRTLYDSNFQKEKLL